MSLRIATIGLYVRDQNEALRFYTEAIGFVIHTDWTLNDYRWLTVGPKDQPDVEFVLTALKPGAGGQFDQETVDIFRKLQESGKISGAVLRTDDLDAFYQNAQAKGAEFTVPPRHQPYGYEAVFKDPSGNWFSILEENSTPDQPPAQS